MNASFIERTPGTADQTAAALRSTRIVLDGRHPRPLDHREHVLQVMAGHVDIFAVSIPEGGTEGARHHLFRVERGEIILDLPETVDSPGNRIQVVAVGGPGA